MAAARDFAIKDEYENNILMAAILKGNQADAIEILKDPNSASIINDKNLGNTALLLAIKRGMLDIAHAMLSQNHLKNIIDVNVMDDNGYTALDLACVLRQNKLITAIIGIGKAKIHYTSETNVPGLDAANFLYSQTPELITDAFKKHNKFVEHPDDTAIAVSNNPLIKSYTFIIWHMEELCKNLDRCAEIQLAERPNNKKWWPETTAPSRQLRSEDRFRENLSRNIDNFLAVRDAIPVDMNLLNELNKLSLNKSRISKTRTTPPPTAATHLMQPGATTASSPGLLATSAATALPAAEPYTAPLVDSTQHVKIKGGGITHSGSTISFFAPPPTKPHLQNKTHTLPFKKK